MLNQTQQQPKSEELNWQWSDKSDETVERPNVLPAPTLSKKQINLLVKELASASTSKRFVAERELQDLDCNTLLTVLASVRMSTRSSRKLLPGAICLMIAPPLVNKIFHVHMPPTMWVTLPFMLMASYFALRKSHKTGVISLVRFENVESMGELASALEIPDENVQYIVRPALIQMLPKLKTSDSRLLNDTGRRAMRRFLMGKLESVSGVRRGDQAINKRLVIALLGALQEIGDASFLPVVTSLADSKNKTISPEVSVAAQE